MSALTHEMVPRDYRFEYTHGHPLNDWAVVAKVADLGPEQLSNLGVLLPSRFIRTGEEFFDITPDDNERTASIIASLPSYNSLYEVMNRAITLTVIGLDEITRGDGIIVNVRTSKWRDLSSLDNEGNKIIDIRWDRLKSDSNGIANALLESRGHGLLAYVHTRCLDRVSAADFAAASQL